MNTSNSTSDSNATTASTSNAASRANTSLLSNASSSTNTIQHQPAVQGSANRTGAWAPDALDVQDDFDSDQLDEDESYSWPSTDNQDHMFIERTAPITARYSDQAIAMSSLRHLMGSASGATSVPHWRDWRCTNTIMPHTNLNVTMSRQNSSRSSSRPAAVVPLPISNQIVDTKQVDKLIIICVKYIAKNVPFEVVESYREPVPEDLQLKITGYSFPDRVGTIRMYSCLANGNADEYQRGEQLYQDRKVQKIMQIGFYLSAQVVVYGGPSNTVTNQNGPGYSSNRGHLPHSYVAAALTVGSTQHQTFHVAIICDRKKITSCTCTCSKQNKIWCSHVIAVCLHRILDSASVEYRLPVADTLLKLTKDQLLKFAQFFIYELAQVNHTAANQQILPTAQRLLDEMLFDKESCINASVGVGPDPTSGASRNDTSVWCLDEHVLGENVRKTLQKFIMPAPNVVSDVESLECHSSSSATATEYTSLLRPIRGREPEGMWNLMAMVREMFRVRDKNALVLLRTLTCECMAIEQILQLWFLVKSSQFYYDKPLFNNVSTHHHHHRVTSNNGSGSSNLTTPIHQACANLMDEIVTLWKLACLNPQLQDFQEKQLYREQLFQWQQSVFDRLKKFYSTVMQINSQAVAANLVNSSMGGQAGNVGANSSSTATNYEKLLRRLDTDLFNGFLPALYASDMKWNEFELGDTDLPGFMSHTRSLLVNIELSWNKSNETKQATKQLESSIECVKTETKLTRPSTSEATSLSSNVDTTDPTASIYSFDFDPVRMRAYRQSSTNAALDPLSLSNLSKDLDVFKARFLNTEANGSCMNEEASLDDMFSRCEALHAHGFFHHSCILAQLLSEYMIKAASNNCLLGGGDLAYTELEWLHQQGILVNEKKQRTRCTINFNTTVLWRCYLLCSILNDSVAKFAAKEDNNDNKITNNSQLESIFVVDEFVSSLYDSSAVPTQSLKAKMNHLAVRIGLLGLETPRLPAISKSLEVKLFNQEQEMMNLLKRLELSSLELELIRQRAIKLRNSTSTNKSSSSPLLRLNYNYNTLPISLSSYIFDCLNGRSNSGNETTLSDQELAFDACLTVLGMKANISEAQHSLLCEGIRRQRGDLILTLLFSYKDCEEKLLKIMDKVLDRDIYVLFKKSSLQSFNPFSPNLKKIQQQQLQEYNDLVAEHSSHGVKNSDNKESKNNSSESQSANGTKSNNPETASTQTKSSTGKKIALPQTAQNMLNKNRATAMDSLSSGWEESENESSNLSGDVALLEAKHKCRSLGISATGGSSNLPSQSNSLNKEDDSNNTTVVLSSGDNSPITPSGSSNTNMLVRKPVLVPSSSQMLSTSTKSCSKTVDDSGDDSSLSSNETSNGKDVSTATNDTTKAIKNEKSEEMIGEVPSNIPDASGPSQPNSSEILSNSNASTLKNTPHHSSRSTINKLNYMANATSLNHQPSEALSHFMTEFAKTLLKEAGGSLNSSSVFWNTTTNHHSVAAAAANLTGPPSNGPHRNLYICSFLISLYSLGLHNAAQPNWLSRTYSSLVTAINGQAVDIGFPAICIFIECWQGLLTPSECVSLADRASRGRDNMAVKAAAELALSALRYAHMMNFNEIQRALVQCKEQGGAEMLQRACYLVEQAFREDIVLHSGQLLDIFFSVAKRWDELFTESMREKEQQLIKEQANKVPGFCGAESQPAASQHFTNNPYVPQFGQMMTSTQSNSNNIENNGQGPPMNAFNPCNVSMPHMPMMVPNNNMLRLNHHGMIAPTDPFILMNQSTRNMPGTHGAWPILPQASLLHHPNMQIDPVMYEQLMFQQHQILMQNLFIQQQLHMQQQQQQQKHQQAFHSMPEMPIDEASLQHLKSAFRVGMRGLRALAPQPKRNGDPGNGPLARYRSNPPYADDVKWLLNISIKLDMHLKTSNHISQFCQTALNTINNPFLLQELIFDLTLTSKIHLQATNGFTSPIVNTMVMRCMELYSVCCAPRKNPMPPNEQEDFYNMILNARKLYFASNNAPAFNELLNRLATSKKFSKDLMHRINEAIQKNMVQASNLASYPSQQFSNF